MLFSGKKIISCIRRKLEGKTEEEIQTAVNEYVRKILEKLSEKERYIERILNAERQAASM